jgi:radical SAM superfamily enzyme YgiQ (UPF0313 family)
MPSDTPSQRILLVYPELSSGLTTLQHVLPILGKKAKSPPLGLLTVAALTPARYAVDLLDLNVEPWSDARARAADLVAFSALVTQKAALFNWADRARRLGKFVVMGGPYPTTSAEECAPHADALVLNEAEITWPLFLADWEAGRPRPVYQTQEKADLSRVPPPRYDLVDFNVYSSASVQFSRGCPFECEFCDVIVQLGRAPRLKTPSQMINELDALRAAGYRGQVLFADDNLVGHLAGLRPLLRRLSGWNREQGNPFHFFFQASTTLADHPLVLQELVDARFNEVFLGLETPVKESLAETRKFQNTRRSLEACVRTIQGAGILVYGGFIVGFDHDPPDVFARQEAFITQAAVADAFVGLLVALPGTALHDRLKREGRLMEGEDAILCADTNIRLRQPREEFLTGYGRLLTALFSPEAFFARAGEELKRLSPARRWRDRCRTLRGDLSTLFSMTPLRRKAPWRGVVEGFRILGRLYRASPPPFRRAAIRFIGRVLRDTPERAVWITHFLIMGYHYHQFTFNQILPALRARGEGHMKSAAVVVEVGA